MQKTLDRRQFVKGIGAAAAIAPSHSAASMTEFGGLEYRSATELVAALANKRISSAELVEFVITRIEALDKHINAVVVRDFEHARAAAVAADAALARGERRPLLGLPMTVKETFNVHRLPTSWGDRTFQEWRPTGDALAVSRLKAAGAIILGKTNVPLMAEDWQSYNDIYGTTNNPWDLGRTPGGSSGGRPRRSPLVLQRLNSARMKAAHCACRHISVAFMPTNLRGGLPPGSPQVPVRGDLAVAGPMARSAADLDLALGVIAGPDELSDGIAYRLALPAARHERLRDYRALVIDTHPLCPTAASIQVALGRLAERLSRSGCRISRASPLLPGCR
jgi:amidase